MPPAESLQELFARLGSHCQGYYALDSDGSPTCPEEDPDACAWCLLGGLMAVYPDPRKRGEVERKLGAALGYEGDCWGRLSDWSEAPGRTGEEVRELCERAGV